MYLISKLLTRWPVFSIYLLKVLPSNSLETVVASQYRHQAIAKETFSKAGFTDRLLSFYLPFTSLGGSSERLPFRIWLWETA